MFSAHNLLSKNSSGTYKANLYSLHSFLGLSALILYGANYLIGFSSFLLYSVLGLSEETKSKILPIHVLLGTFSLFAGGDQQLVFLFTLILVNFELSCVLKLSL